VNPPDSRAKLGFHFSTGEEGNGAVTFSDLTAQSWQATMILKLIIGVLVGGGLGFAYFKFVGCSSGACPLTSHPVISTIYGAVLGAIIANSFR
jgi:hypothetical protein